MFLTKLQKVLGFIRRVFIQTFYGLWEIMRDLSYKSRLKDSINISFLYSNYFFFPIIEPLFEVFLRTIDTEMVTKWHLLFLQINPSILVINDIILLSSKIMYGIGHWKQRFFNLSCENVKLWRTIHLEASDVCPRVRNISSTVHTLIKRKGYVYLYYYAKVQTLLPEDFISYIDICSWCLEKVAKNNIFASRLL